MCKPHIKSRLDAAAKKTYQPFKGCLGISYCFSCMLIGISNQACKVYHEYKGETCLNHPNCKESLAPWAWPIVYIGHFFYSIVYLRPELGSKGASLNPLTLGWKKEQDT